MALGMILPRVSIGDPAMSPRARFHPEVNVQPRPRVPVRYPNPKPKGKRRPVTVCIAAICQHWLEPRIVLCADTRLDSTWSGSSDGNRKIEPLAYGWMGLLAGDWNAVQELHSLLKVEFLANGAPFDRSRLHGLLTEASDHYRSGPLFTRGKEPEIIVCGFMGSVPVIAGVAVGQAKKATVYFRHSFATCGTGGPIAETLLNIRDCKPVDSIERVIYTVYEAKKYSEKASGVGPETRIAILAPTPDGAANRTDLSVLAPDGIAALEGMRKTYGLQDIGVSLGLLPHFTRPTG